MRTSTKNFNSYIAYQQSKIESLQKQISETADAETITSLQNIIKEYQEHIGRTKNSKHDLVEGGI